MKKSHLSTVITAVFFVGLFVIAFTSSDIQAGAMRVLLFLAATCSASVAWSFYKQRAEAELHNKKITYIMDDADAFSKEYGDLYVMADKLKQQRKNKQKALSVGKA